MKSTRKKNNTGMSIHNRASQSRGARANGASSVRAVVRQVLKRVKSERTRAVGVQPVLPPGTRVQIVAPSAVLELRSDTGTIIGPDQWEGYYLIHLDLPAISRDTVDGSPEDLPNIREHVENLKVFALSAKSVKRGP